MKEIETLKTSDINQRLHKELFEKRIMGDFRLYAFRYEFIEKTIIVIVLISVSPKKKQDNDLENLIGAYDERYYTIKEKVKKQFNL
jgi:hypothetical protein